MDHEQPTPEEHEEPRAATRDAPDAALPEKLAELQAALTNATKYTVRIFRETAGGEWALLATVYKLPDPDEVGRLYGGGRYLLNVQWRTQGVTTGRMNRREIEFRLDGTYSEQLAAERARHGQAAPAAGLGLAEVLATAERLAALRGNGGGESAVVGLVEKLMDRMDRDRERTDAKFEKLVEIITNRPDPLTEWRRSMDLAKEMGLPVPMGGQEPEKSPWLEVAGMVADNAGKFLELMTEAKRSTAAKIRIMAREPMARKVAAQAAAIKDPAKRAQMIALLDSKVGAEKTDAILQALEVTR